MQIHLRRVLMAKKGVNPFTAKGKDKAKEAKKCPKCKKPMGKGPGTCKC
jgi:hypothetical protein